VSGTAYCGSATLALGFRSGLYYEGVYYDDLEKTLDSSSESWYRYQNFLQAINPPMNSTDVRREWL